MPPGIPPLAEPGLHVIEGDQLRAGPPPNPAARSHARSPLADLMPGTINARGWFTQVAVANPTIAESAWYKFASFKIGEDIPQDVGLFGYSIQALPTDNQASAGITWGDARGQAAGIVIGINLPGSLQAWFSAPSPIVGVETTGASILSPLNTRQIVADYGFPTGKYNDTAPNKLIVEKSISPYLHRMRYGHTLDFALIVRGSQISGVTGTLVGSVRVNAHLMRTVEDIAFGQG